VKSKQALRLVFGAWIASATFLMLGCDDTKPADTTKPAAGAPKPEDKKPADEPKKPA
jgi:hypothetical protein